MANNISPTLGYFGPISRAKYAQLIAVSNSSDTAAGETISLPNVSDSEVIIDSGGINTTESYIKKFLTDTSSTSTFPFDAKKFESILKDKNGVFLFIPDLAQKAIQDGMSQDIKNSLAVQEEFINAKLMFLKTIKVSDKVIVLHKKMIGFDKLTLQLAQKISDFGDGKVSKE